MDTMDKNTVEHIQINGFDGVLFEEGETYNIVYADTQHNFFIHIVSVGISRETTLALISEISFVNS